MYYRTKGTQLLKPHALHFLLVLTAAAQQPPDLVTLRGRVTNPITGQPRAGVEMKLDDENYSEITFPVRTNGTGHFKFPPVKRQIFILWATSPEIGLVRYDSDFPNQYRAFTVTPPDKETFLDFPIAPRATLRGKVETSAGVPLHNAKVSFRRPNFKNNRIAMETASEVYTNEDGEYIFSKMAAGNYILCATPSRTDRIAPPVGLLDLNAPPNYQIYAETCRPPQTFDADASTTVNFSIPPTRRLKLSGSVTGIPAIKPGDFTSPQTWVSIDSNGAFRGGLNQTTMTFEYEDLEPGRYFVSATRTVNQPQSFKSAGTFVTMNSDVSGLILAIRETANLRFTVASSSTEDLSSKLESLRLVDDLSGKEGQPIQGLSMPIYGDADYWLSDRELGDVCLASATLDGGESIFRKRFHIEGGKDHTIALVLSRNCGSVTGRVLLNGKPAPPSRLAAMLSGSVEQPGDVLSFTTVPDGTFHLSGLPPGVYYLAAWQESNSPFSFAAAGFVPVTVVASQTRNIDIPIYHQKP